MRKSISFIGTGAIIAMLFLFGINIVSASVLLNEIAWMGTDVSSSDEWIELYNNGDSPISLDNWNIISEDGQPDIVLQGSISGGGYFLLERSDDSTVPGVVADFIYSGSLGNSGEYLELKDSSGIVQDTIDARDEWPAGDNTKKETMQWTGSTWVTGSGTPRAKNVGVEVIVDEDEEGEQPVATTTPDTVSGSGSTPYTPPEFRPRLQVDGGEDMVTVVGAEVRFRSRAIDWEGKEVDYERVRFVWNFGDGKLGDGRNVNHYYAYPGTYMARVELFSGNDVVSDNVNIEVQKSPLVISEVLSGEQGWIELFNNSDAILDIGRWILQDNSSRFIFPTGTIIAPFARPVLSNKQSGMMFEKDKYVELMLPSGKITDTFSLMTFDGEISTVRDLDKFYTGSPTPGEKNIVISSPIFSSVSAPKQKVTIPAVTAREVVEQGAEPPLREEAFPEEVATTTAGPVNKNTQANVLRGSMSNGRAIVWFIGSFSFAVLSGFLLLFLRQKYYKA